MVKNPAKPPAFYMVDWRTCVWLNVTNKVVRFTSSERCKWLVIWKKPGPNINLHGHRLLSIQNVNGDMRRENRKGELCERLGVHQVTITRWGQQSGDRTFQSGLCPFCPPWLLSSLQCLEIPRGWDGGHWDLGDTVEMSSRCLLSERLRSRRGCSHLNWSWALFSLQRWSQVVCWR